VVTGAAAECRRQLIDLYSQCDDQLAIVRSSYDPSEQDLRTLRQCFVNRSSLYGEVVTKYARLASVRDIGKVTGCSLSNSHKSPLNNPHLVINCMNRWYM
jgi:hypothetical protein